MYVPPEASPALELNLDSRRLSHKDLIIKFLGALGLYPHILFSSMPFKIFEYQEMVKGVVFSSNDRILDLGCGPGLQTLLLGKRGGEVVGLDVSAPSVARAQHKAALLKSRIRAQFLSVPLLDAGFPSESFDKIFSFCVIEHIAGYPAVLAELYRLLKPGGDLIISVDALQGISDPELISLHRREHHVEKYFSPNELQSALQQAGFEDAVIYPIFTSAYATRLFTRGVRTGFQFSLLSAMRAWMRLRRAESRSRNKAGLFLVARCRK